MFSSHYQTLKDNSEADHGLYVLSKHLKCSKTPCEAPVLPLTWGLKVTSCCFGLGSFLVCFLVFFLPLKDRIQINWVLFHSLMQQPWRRQCSQNHPEPSPAGAGRRAGKHCWAALLKLCGHGGVTLPPDSHLQVHKGQTKPYPKLAITAEGDFKGSCCLNLNPRTAQVGRDSGSPAPTCLLKQGHPRACGTGSCEQLQRGELGRKRPNWEI